jgi:polar amino acid transport system substrate-binding protein
MQACCLLLRYCRAALAGRPRGTKRDTSSRASSLPAVLGALLLAVSPFAMRPALAQNCGGDYVIKDGETLAQIAQRVYGNSSQWTLIFYANQDRLGTNATLLVPGQAIKLPCLGQPQPSAAATPAALPPAQPPAPAGFVLSNLVKRLEFLTAEGYTPYADRTLENGGLILDLLSASMKQIEGQTAGSFTYQVSWVNDWAAHLNPLLITRAFDAGVPWTKLDCSDLAALDPGSRYKCQKFFFSDPFYEDVTTLFVRADSPITFQSDDEIVGRTLCRTKGWSTFDLDKKGRSWIKDGKIVLMQPPTPEDCFRLLESGAVDAVVISDLTGRAIAQRMGMLARVKATERPIHIETMHAIVAKTHPNARTILYYINSSLAKLRESGEYDRIVARHLDRFWSSLEEKQADPEPTASIESTRKAAKP